MSDQTTIKRTVAEQRAISEDDVRYGLEKLKRFRGELDDDARNLVRLQAEIGAAIDTAESNLPGLTMSDADLAAHLSES